MKNLAQLVSLVFHPLLLTSYAFLLMFALPTYFSLYPYIYKKSVFLIIFTASFISPLLIILILLNLRKIDSLQLNNRKERIFPFFMVFVLYVSAWLISKNLFGGISFYLSNFLPVSAGVLLLVILISLKYKISVHMAGLGGFTGFFYIWFQKTGISEILCTIADFDFLHIHFFALLFIIAGITASARLLLKAHNVQQVFAGYFIGLATGLMSFILY